MPLTNKFLRYSPEITLEIFTLVWDKLIESGFKSKYNNKLYSEFDCFKGKHNYFIIDDICFNTHMSLYIINGLETTVQEILGYDPFVKDKVIPEYVECIKVATQNTKIGEIFKCRYRNGFFEFEYNDKSGISYNSWDGWSCVWESEVPQKHFRPSTKEAFDAQNKPKSIEKWSVGTYVLFLKDLMHVKAGYIDIINESLDEGGCIYLEKYLTLNTDREKQNKVKWFATKSEAEKFAKTLVEPVKCGNGILDAVEPKQPLKQVVHCKTQEEWGFVSNKIGYKFINKFELGNSDTINPVSKGCQSKSF